MHPRFSLVFGKSVLAAALLVAGTGFVSARGDDPGFLGRLFRFGGSAPASSSAAPASSASSLPYGFDSSSSPNYIPRTAVGSSATSPLPTFDSVPPPRSIAPTATPLTAPAGPGPQRLAPQPRVSSAITSADPVLTRFALGRSNDGSQFAMFLQIFADGTVVDSEGVHHLRPADIRPILDAAQSGELYRVKGHCGAPATDFIEYVHIVTYEHRMGRLTAHSFSYSGNPQGCDHIVRHLHTALENLQAKLSGQPAATAPTATANPVPLGSSPLSSSTTPSNLQGFSPAPLASPRSSVQPVPPSPNRGASTSVGSVIPLTPIDSPR